MDASINRSSDSVNSNRYWLRKVRESFVGIPISSEFGCNMGVTATQNRQAWIKRLTPERGSIRKLANAAQVAESYISNIRSGRRSCGEAIARRIEKRLGMAQGQMDQPPPSGASGERPYGSGGGDTGPIPVEEEILGQVQQLDTAGRVLFTIVGKLSPADQQAVVDYALNLFSARAEDSHKNVVPIKLVPRK